MTPVIYLHGFASSPASKKARYFRERFESIGVKLEVPDLAEGNFEGLTLSGQLSVIQRVADGRPVHLMGSSMGGYLAALYAARHPEVDRVVLMAPAFGFSRRWSARLGPGQMDDWRRTGFLPIFHYGEQSESRVGYQLMKDAMEYEEYPEVRQPVLIFHGRRDEVVPVAASEEFARSRSNAELRVFDSDHELLDVLPAMWEQTRGFLAV